MTDDARHVLTVPSYRGTLSRLPRDRRAAFLAYLRQLIWDAFEAPSPNRKRPETTATPSQLDLAAWACAACGGECCSKGGTHAYLDEPSISRVIRQHPKLSRRALAELYASHLPDQSFSGSCVFHAVNGCTLPRDLRADLCNSFYCTPLRHFFREHRQFEPQNVRIQAKRS
jgi:hypothetical protein